MSNPLSSMKKLHNTIRSFITDSNVSDLQKKNSTLLDAMLVTSWWKGIRLKLKLPFQHRLLCQEHQVVPLYQRKSIVGLNHTQFLQTLEHIFKRNKNITLKVTNKCESGTKFPPYSEHYLKQIKENQKIKRTKIHIQTDQANEFDKGQCSLLSFVANCNNNYKSLPRKYNCSGINK